MPLTVIDYCETYFVAIHGGELPSQREGKFVLIAHETDEFAVFAPRGLAHFHANIVERFLSLERRISGHYNTKRDVFYPIDPAWAVMGGGHWQADETTGELRLFGSSQAYGSLDLPDLATRLELAGGLDGMQRILVG
jgi:hypothetical protein